MPAPDYATLYDFESQMEAAWADVLIAALAALPMDGVYVTRDLGIMATPRIEMEFIPGAALKQRYRIGTPVREVPNAFSALLVCRIVTTRELTGNSELHGKIRGFVRYTLSASANVILANTNLPYLQILEMLSSGSSPKIFDEKNQDITELQYEMQFAIDNSAWPT